MRTRPHVCMHTRPENAASQQWTADLVWLCIASMSSVQIISTLSICRPVCFDEHQFHV